MKFSSMESAATKIQAEKIQGYLASNQSPQKVFLWLNLDNMGIDLPGDPLFTTWMKHVKDFNKKNPKSQESVFTPICMYYSCYMGMINKAMNNPSTVKIAKLLEREQSKYWLDHRDHPENVFRFMDLNQADEKILANRNFKSWAKYLNDFNRRYPEDKTRMIDRLRAYYNDINLLTKLNAAKEDPKTKKQAMNLESALPIFEVVAAPELAVWSQAAITSFIRVRRQYETKITERCSTTGEVPETVAWSMRTSPKSRVLEHVAHYILKTKMENVTDAMFLAEVKRKIGGAVNDRVPDVSRFFAELKMDLGEVDVEARIVKYYMGFARLVEDNGLTGLLGRGGAVDETGRQRMKMRCKMLLKHVAAEILKVELTGIVELTHREAKARDCSAASAEQKAYVEKILRERRSRPQERVKTITTDGEPAFRSAVINGMLDVPFCPVTGSDVNIIGRRVMAELRDLIPELPTVTIDPPLEVVAAGGNLMLCHEKVQLDVQIVTAVGPLCLHGIECIWLEPLEEELLLGKSTLQSIGVDFYGVFEQLAQQHIDAAGFEADDIPSNQMHVLGARKDNKTTSLLHNMVDEAINAGFEPTMADQLRQLVIEYSDVFRVSLGRDEATDAQPLDVWLQEGAQLHRSGVRRYPEVQRQFLQEYVRELEEAGLVGLNSQRRWACPSLPVAKRVTDEYRITIDYRPANRLTVLLDGAAPNIAVVTESVVSCRNTR
ncbi:uncharacterized protein IUM83_11930 [Phytophthora cinnamomi]|uniref:uncharacterized protein n=1 Tax=Phytophthora cinnamomi TaxID=4785 RepID=UPI0035598B28|nr:hypothetical protein IUM83_11930 [Phytophthora cinnamomi]